LLVILTVTSARLLSGEQQPGERLGALCGGLGRGKEWCGVERRGLGRRGFFIAEARRVGGGHGQWEGERAVLRPMEVLVVT
jgi:hypothetical protein